MTTDSRLSEGLWHMANPIYQAQGTELIVNAPRVSEITLGPGSDTPAHEHTAVEEVCYCLEGDLWCGVEGEEAVVLVAGEKKRLRKKRSELPCRFLFDPMGWGRFDFVATRKS